MEIETIPETEETIPETEETIPETEETIPETEETEETIPETEETIPETEETRIVYIDSDKSLKDINFFSQYIMNLTEKIQYKLITIIGESHNNLYDCDVSDDNKISIEEFIFRTPEIKTKLILESPDKEYTCQLNSNNIQNVIKTLRNKTPEEIKNIQTIYIDYRYKFLDYTYHYWLYHQNDKIINLHSNIIIEKFIEPFYSQIGEKSRYYEGEIYSPLVNILYTNYLPSIGNRFNNLKKNIVFYWDSSRDRRIFIEELKKTWAYLSDFYVLRELFKQDDTQEYIILIGYGHAFNINDYIKNVLSKVIEHKVHFCNAGNKQLITHVRDKLYNCVKLNNTSIVEIIDETDLSTDKKGPLLRDCMS